MNGFFAYAGSFCNVLSIGLQVAGCFPSWSAPLKSITHTDFYLLHAYVITCSIALLDETLLVSYSASLGTNLATSSFLYFSPLLNFLFIFVFSCFVTQICLSSFCSVPLIPLCRLSSVSKLFFALF